jgi:hypothetical protein
MLNWIEAQEQNQIKGWSQYVVQITSYIEKLIGNLNKFHRKPRYLSSFPG